jgi:hypothetical protein
LLLLSSYLFSSFFAFFSFHSHFRAFLPPRPAMDYLPFAVAVAGLNAPNLELKR